MRDPNGYNEATLIYLILLLIIIGGAMAIGSKQQLNRTLQQMAIWGLIFIGMIGAYSMRDQLEEQLFPARPLMVDRGTVAVNRAWDGHFYIDILVNGKTIEFVVDTGASSIVLTKRDAASIGINLDTLDFSGRARTANGIVSTASVQLQSMDLGRFKDRNLRASVNGGELDTSLLGMDYLKRFSKIEITQNQLLLIR